MLRDLFVGVGAWVSVTVMGAAAWGHLAQPDALEQPPAGSTPPRTLSPGEPRPIGPTFDDDRALPRAARAIASYELSAKLDPDAHEVEGRGTIRFWNASSESLDAIYVHLYLNAFKNSRTTFLRSPFGRSRSGTTTSDWGYIDVRRLARATDGAVNLWEAAEPALEDGDETDMRVPLTEPLGPGEKLTLEVEWTSRLPAIVERTGHAGRFHMVAQWFPKLARLEPSGRFAHFEFHPHSEFFADFGSYDVTLDVPDSMVVGATGQRLSSESTEGRRIERYRAHNVHDFAWTAWDDFIERTTDVRGVSVRLLHPPGHDENADVTLEAVGSGLELFGNLFGKYPYSTLTVVHPPAAARAAGGMEYPTLITTGGPWYAASLSPFIERVTLHELAHQWFYGLVATDEHSFPFLDEGLASYAEGLAMQDRFGTASGMDLGGLEVSGGAYMRAAAASAAHRDIVGRPAAAFASFADLSALVYARTTTLLETLARVWGRDRVNRAIGRYARKYRFEHPSPRHLVAAFREAVGEEPAAVLSRCLFEGGWVDYVAHEIRSAPVRSPAGIFDEPSGRITKPTPGQSPSRYQSQVLIYREGTLELPVDIELTLADDSKLRRRWDGRGRWTTLKHEGPHAVVGAVVDPDGRIPLDEDLLNNATSVRRGSSVRTLERLTYWAELAMGLFGP